MIKILFVCHGNICRSPMAQYIFADLVAKAGLSGRFEIDSAAVSREEIGAGMYPPARRELTRRGIPYGDHAARQITPDDYRHYDRIYYMDGRNARRLSQMLPADPQKIRPLLSRDVADPWYTGDFERAFEDILEGCKRILEEFDP